jgi:glucose/arabinose dehydrogenase
MFFTVRQCTRTLRTAAVAAATIAGLSLTNHALAVPTIAVKLVACGALAQIPQGEITINLEQVAAGLTSPVFATHAGDGSGRLFVVDQAGQIRIIQNGVLLPDPFLDLTSEIVQVNPFFDERGVLGLAFHPDYANNDRFFVRYSKPRDGDPSEPCFGTSRGCHEEVLAEFSVSADPNVANPNGNILFRVDEPQFNHNSGQVAFGPDGFLYFTLGDGGGANDSLHDPALPHGPIGNGQNIETHLGSILRIDVDSAPQPPLAYAIPPDNPFVAAAGQDEIYAYGFRNPYRFSFDDGPGGDGGLFLADVGQNLFEEIDVVVNGGNYGWVIREGFNCFDPFNPHVPPAACSNTGPSGEPLLDPVAEYDHGDGIAVVGGFVYRGSMFPTLWGKYIFGDFSQDFAPTGRLFYLDADGDLSQIFEFQLGEANAPLGLYVFGFGEDESGEVYLLSSQNLAPVGDGGLVFHIASEIPSGLDIKPGSCPNSFNRDSHGVLPVALVGTANFDVAQVDLSTVRLKRADGVGGEVAPNEGPPGPHSVIADVATLFVGQECGCSNGAGDGTDDLLLKFRSDEVTEVLQLSELSSGALVPLVVTGSLIDGTTFTSSSDCVRLVPPGSPPGVLGVVSAVPGAWVDVSPLDEMLDGGGFADFERYYPVTTVATLTAEPTADGLTFYSWWVDGVRQNAWEATVQVTVGESVLAKAVYVNIKLSRPTFKPAAPARSRARVP